MRGAGWVLFTVAWVVAYDLQGGPWFVATGLLGALGGGLAAALTRDPSA